MKNYELMSKINLQEPQRNRKFCQFNKDQYCTWWWVDDREGGAVANGDWVGLRGDEVTVVTAEGRAALAGGLDRLTVAGNVVVSRAVGRTNKNH